MSDTKNGTAWVCCPRCGSKTRTQFRPHTVLLDFPLFCPKCRYECVVDFRDGRIPKVFSAAPEGVR